MSDLVMSTVNAEAEAESLPEDEPTTPRAEQDDRTIPPSSLSSPNPPRPLFSPYQHHAVHNFLTDDDGVSLLEESQDEALAVPLEASFDYVSGLRLSQTSRRTVDDSTATLRTITSRVARFSTRIFAPSVTTIDSVATHLAQKLGQKTLKLSAFCNIIAHCASLERAKIMSVECYKEWTLYGIMHRTLIFHLQREGRTDVWLRVDRRRSHDVSGFTFLRQGGKTEANDVAHLAGTKAHLLRRPTAEPENRMEFGSPPNLGVFRFCLQVICEELLEYHIWPENCWFMCSLMQEHLFETGQGSFNRGSHIRLELAPAIRLQVRNRVWHVVAPASLTGGSRIGKDISTPPPEVTPCWKTVDGGIDTRDFDFPLLATLVDGLLQTIEQHHKIIAEDGSRNDLHVSIIQLAGRAIRLEFILRQQNAVPSSSRTLDFLSTHPSYLSRHAAAPLHLPFLGYLRHVYQIAPEAAWHDTASRLMRAARGVSRVNPAAWLAYTHEVRAITATHLDGKRRWTDGQVLKGHTRDVQCVAFSPDGKQIASASHDRTVRRWDALTGESIGKPMRGHVDWVRAVAFSPDGTRIVSGSYDGTLQRWDASSGEPIGATMQGHTYSVWSVAYSPNGKVIVSGSSDHTLRRWDASTGETIGEPLIGHTGPVRSVAFSPDGKRVVSGSDDRTIRIWDVLKGKAVGKPWKGHTRGVTSVAFSPDGRFVVSGSGDTTVRRWNPLTGEGIDAPLAGHTGRVNCVAVSPDGKQIASASDDGSIQIWDATSGELIGKLLEGHTNLVYSVAFSPDGREIVSGSTDRTVRIWDSLEDLDSWTQSG